MNEQYPSIKLFGLSFNLTNDIGVLVSAVLVFLLVFWLSRNLKMRPGGNRMCWNGSWTLRTVSSKVPCLVRSVILLIYLRLRSSYLFSLVTKLGYSLKSISAKTLGSVLRPRRLSSDDVGHDGTGPLTTSRLSSRGFKGYLRGYASPVAILLPINLLEEFTNFITLSMRLYGEYFRRRSLSPAHQAICFLRRGRQLRLRILA